MQFIICPQLLLAAIKFIQLLNLIFVISIPWMVYTDSYLAWHSHIQYIVRMISQSSGILLRLSCPIKLKIILLRSVLNNNCGVLFKYSVMADEHFWKFIQGITFIQLFKIIRYDIMWLYHRCMLHMVFVKRAHIHETHGILWNAHIDPKISVKYYPSIYLFTYINRISPHKVCVISIVEYAT